MKIIVIDDQENVEIYTEDAIHIMEEVRNKLFSVCQTCGDICLINNISEGECPSCTDISHLF